MLITPKLTLCKISINSEHKAMNFMTITSLFLIIYQNQRLSNIPQHTSLGDGMVFIVENNQDTAMRGIRCLDLVKKHSENSLT